MSKPRVTTFTRNVRAIRKQKLRTKQEHIAHLLGIKQTTYAAWEQGHGRAKYSELIKLSEIAGVSVDDILKKELNFDENN